MVRKRKTLLNLFGVSPSYLTLVEKGDYCFSIDKIIELSHKTGVSTDFILKGEISTSDMQVKEAIIGLTDQQITKAFGILRDIAMMMKTDKPNR